MVKTKDKSSSEPDEVFEFVKPDKISKKRKVAKAFNPFSGHGKWATKVFKPWEGEDHNAVRNIIKAGVSRQAAFLKSVKEQRDPDEYVVDPRSNFDELLYHWGINKNNLPKVIKVLSFHSFIFLAFGLYGLYLLIFGIINNQFYPYIIYSLILMVMGFPVFLMRRWRISVLKNRKFKSFKSWIKFWED